MRKAIKKPVEITFWTYDEVIKILNDPEELEDFDKKVRYEAPFCTRLIGVDTLEGTTYNFDKGWVLIKGIKGEYYPCEGEIFKKTYNLKEIYND